MQWYGVGARGVTRDLWLDPTGPNCPEYGPWLTSGGDDVWQLLDSSGPGAVDLELWWQPPHDHRGTRLVDFVWQTSMSHLKVVSVRLRDLLVDHGARLQSFDLDIRWSDQSPIPGYVGILEELGKAGPAHSLRRKRRSHRFVISQDIRSAIESAGLTGLEIEPVSGPFLRGDDASYWLK